MNLTCFRCREISSILYRTTPYGTIPAKFTCNKCLSPEEKLTIAPDVDEITKLIANK